MGFRPVILDPNLIGDHTRIRQVVAKFDQVEVRKRSVRDFSQHRHIDERTVPLDESLFLERGSVASLRTDTYADATIELDWERSRGLDFRNYASSSTDHPDLDGHLRKRVDVPVGTHRSNGPDVLIRDCIARRGPVVFDADHKVSGLSRSGVVIGKGTNVVADVLAEMSLGVRLELNS